MKNLLWLDDIRNPFLNLEWKVPQDENGDWYNVNWVLNYEQFTQWIETGSTTEVQTITTPPAGMIENE
jgi:hypothetical protein